MDERPKCETGDHQNARGEKGNNLFDPSHSNFLLDMSLEAKDKSKNELLGPHQHKKLLHSEGTVNKTKRQPSEWEEISANDICDKGLVSKS